MPCNCHSLLESTHRGLGLKRTSERDGPIPHLSGLVLDASGEPLSGAMVTVSAVETVKASTLAAASARRGVSGGTANLSHPLDDATTDNEGRFELEGALEAPATEYRDGSVQLELMISTESMVRFYWVNLVPPSRHEEWREPDGSQPNLFEGPHTGAAPRAARVAGPSFTFTLGSALREPNVLRRSSTSQSQYTSDDVNEAPAGSDTDNVPTDDEVQDVTADNQAIANGTMDDVEADVAERVRSCPGGAGDLYWTDVNKTTTKWVPIHSHYVLDKFKHQFEWQRTHTTKFGIAVTGDGPNYAGGIVGSRKQTYSTGYKGTKSVSNENFMWKARWIYQKQKQICYNHGYSYDTGRTRWLADEKQGGFDVFTPSNLTRFSCESQFRARLGTDHWASRSTTRRWNGWFEIASVRLPLVAQFETSSAEREVTRATYILKKQNGHGFLCGQGASIDNAAFVEEVQ